MCITRMYHIHIRVPLLHAVTLKALLVFTPDKYGGGGPGSHGDTHLFCTESDPGVGGGQRSLNKC